MKVLCFSDLHLSAGAAYADDRLADQEAVLNQIVDLAAREEVDLILAAGDLFHRPRPVPAALLIFRRFVDRLAKHEIPTIAITGNQSHDIENDDRPCALDLFESRWFRVSRRPEYITEFANVVVVTLPSVPVSRLVAQSESTARAPIFDQAAEALLAIATELRDAHGGHMRVNSEDAGKHVPFILLGHWSVSGASLPNGLPVDGLSEPILDLASLERLNYDAIVLGHVHNQGRFDTTGTRPVLYCGSPMTIDFGESEVRHGCWIVEPGAEWPTQFIPLDDRRFITVDADLYDLGEDFDPTDNLMAYVNATADTYGDLTDAVIRVRYKATEEQARRIDTAALKRSLLDAGAHRVYQISAEIVKQDRARVQGVDENLEPAAALDAWIDANEVVDGEGLRELLARYTAAT